MDKEFETVENRAKHFARENKKRIAEKLADISVYPPDIHPSSVFMSGSPGAGKTEVSVAFLELIEQERPVKRIVRIDPDQLRLEFEDYSGNNAWMFQSAVSILVSAVHDSALKNRQSFILDGTLSNFKQARLNIERSLKRDRQVQILYVHLNPERAWEFVQAREKREGRSIPPERFIDQYILARRIVSELKREFGAKIKVDLLFKELDDADRIYADDIEDVDHHIPESHTRVDLERFVYH